MKHIIRKLQTTILFSLLLLTGCANKQTTSLLPTGTVTPIAVITSEVTPTQAVILESTPTLVSTLTPPVSPTLTSTPIPTSIPEPTQTPIPTPEYYTIENWQDAGIGAKIRFGSFEQDNNKNNGAEEIEWLVIDEDEENFLVVSTYALEAMSFMEKKGDKVTWEDSLVRQWLQEEFYPSAFTEAEKKKIVKTTLDHWFLGNYGDEYKKFSATKLLSKEALDNTEDYVFILAYREYQKSSAYMEESVIGNLSDYVQAKGYDKGVRAGSDRILMWLRPAGQPDKTSYCGYIIENDVKVVETTDEVTSCLLVNPAMWIAKEGEGTEKNFYTEETVFVTRETADGMIIEGLTDESYTQISIPPVIQGKNVIGIAESAFQGNDTVRRIKIPENVLWVDKNAFYGCDNLIELFLPSSLKTLEKELFEITPSICCVRAAKDVTRDIKWLSHRYTNRELIDTILADTQRAGLWNLTYAEFLELYQSIGTENDLFLQMLQERGPCHVDKKGIWYEYDKMWDLTYSFSDVTTEKIYALHYAPFEYNYVDLDRGRYEKELKKAYEDHGGVCGVLAIVGMHFIRNILGETDWSYAYYISEGVNHKVLLVQVEDGRIFQIDNAEVDSWWLGMNFLPDDEVLKKKELNEEVVKSFEIWKNRFEDAEEMIWYDFSIDVRGRGRRVWYNFDKECYETYYYNRVPDAYKVVGTGLNGKVLSMAGNFKKSGYVDLSDITFYSHGNTKDYITE